MKISRISKGERPNVSKWTRKAMRRDYLANDFKVLLNKIDAWNKFKNVMLTIPNPAATKNCKEPFIKVHANEVWGTPGKSYRMKSEED